MPVQRYRDVADVPDPPRARSALEGLAAACAASTFSRAFGHVARLPRGVRRFRSVQEASVDRERLEAAAGRRAAGERGLAAGRPPTGGQGRSRQ